MPGAAPRRGLAPHHVSVLAHELERAEQARRPVEPLTDRHPELDVTDAYEIQRTVMASRQKAGATQVGHKVGITSRAMQLQLGVSEPDFGVLLDDMRIEAGGEVELGSLIQARAEPEIAFILGRMLAGPDLTVEEVLSATEAVAPAIEIIDSRIVDWRIRLADTVADNASSARFVIGEPVRQGSVDLGAIEGRLLVDGQPAGRGRASAVLGHPALALAWLAATLDEHGVVLQPGMVILPGAVCASVVLRAGTTLGADFGPLGRVRASVSAAA